MSTSLLRDRTIAAASHSPSFGGRASVWLVAGCAAALLFHSGITPGLETVVFALTVTTVVGILSIKITRLSLLPRLMVLVYVLPLSTSIGYVFSSEFLFWPIHNVAKRLSEDHELIAEMLMLGAVGLAGLLAGIEFGGFWFGRQNRQNAMPGAESASQNLTLSGPTFLLLLAAAYFFSSLGAPGVTILKASYVSAAQGRSWASAVNFNSSAGVAYIILLLLYIDGERERHGSFARRIKIRTVLFMSVYVILFHQLLVGNRTVIGLIVALTFLYLTGPDLNVDWWRARLLQRQRILRLALPLVVVFCAFVALGSLRSKLADSMPSWGDFEEVMAEGFVHSTWTCVALTNLGLALEIQDGQFEYLNGETYRDYVLSLPPGMLSKWLGYTRPLETDRGPAWWYRGLSLGGVHALVVPYKNFGVAGVFLVLALFGAFGSYCEIRNATQQFWPRLLFGAVASMQIHWFWYTDMNIIRGVMIAAILAVFYHLAPKSAHRVLTRRRSAW